MLSLFIRDSLADTPVRAIDLETTASVNDLRQAISSLFSSNQNCAPKFTISVAGQEIPVTDNEKLLADISICSESIIDVNTCTSITILVETSIELVGEINTPQDAVFFQQWRSRYDYNHGILQTPHQQQKRYLNHEFEIDIDTSTLFEDLSNKIIAFIQQEFNGHIIRKDAIVFAIIVDPVQESSEFNKWYENFGGSFILNTSVEYSRLEPHSKSYSGSLIPHSVRKDNELCDVHVLHDQYNGYKGYKEYKTFKRWIFDFRHNEHVGINRLKVLFKILVVIILYLVANLH